MTAAWSTRPVLSIDTETTGVDVTTARIVEVAAVLIDTTGVRRTWHRMAEMSPSHRANLIPFLERRAAVLQDAAYWACLGNLGTMASDTAVEHLENVLSSDPVRWLNTRPLMVELRRYQAERTRLDDVALKVRNKTYKARKRIGLAR